MEGGEDGEGVDKEAEVGAMEGEEVDMQHKTLLKLAADQLTHIHDFLYKASQTWPTPLPIQRNPSTRALAHGLLIVRATQPRSQPHINLQASAMGRTILLMLPRQLTYLSKAARA